MYNNGTVGSISVTYGTTGPYLPLTFLTSDTERMRIDSSGRVGIFNSSAVNYSGAGARSLVVGSNSSASDPHGITIVGGSSSTSNLAFTDNAGDGSANDYRGLFQYFHPDDSLRVFVASTERMRINSSGCLGINNVGDTQHAMRVQALSGCRCAAWLINNSGLGHVTANSSGTASYDAWAFTTGGGSTQVGGIVINATTTSFNTTSDERLKENIVNAESQLEKIKNIQIREFDWKTTNEHDIGVIAQELENVYSGAVTVGGDNEHERPYSVDYSKLVAPLIKAVQEQQVLIEQLQARLEILENA